MSITENLERVREGIASACHRAGRPVDGVRLVAVSKTRSASEVHEAWEAGQRLFAENYAQELSDKAEALAGLEGLEWHFIGHLQRNKVRRVVPHAGFIQTVDSFRLLDEIEKRTSAAGRTMDVLVEVNVGREPQKAGVDPDDVADLIASISTRRSVSCRGLMVIPPFELDPEQARTWFSGLRQLRDRLGGPTVLPDLSMGMSADYHVAIEEGATIVRVGTAIFGPRP